MLPPIDVLIDRVILDLVSISKQLDRLGYSEEDSDIPLAMARDLRGIYPFDFGPENGKCRLEKG